MAKEIEIYYGSYSAQFAAIASSVFVNDFAFVARMPIAIHSFYVNGYVTNGAGTATVPAVAMGQIYTTNLTRPVEGSQQVPDFVPAGGQSLSVPTFIFTDQNFAVFEQPLKIPAGQNFWFRSSFLGGFAGTETGYSFLTVGFSRYEI